MKNELGVFLESNNHREPVLYFGAIRLYITTHRLARSSPTVIQALELGKPVLVPDRGLLGYRVRNNGLGDVYSYGNFEDLSHKAQKLWQSDLTRFKLPRAFFGVVFQMILLKISLYVD